MSWFRVDDNLALHPKVLAAGNAAVGLWVRAGAWSAQQLTDGFIPLEVVKTLGNVRQAKALVDAGLWTVERQGYRFHQWSTRNPLRADVEARRQEEHEAKVRAGRAGGIASGEARRRQRGEAEGKQAASASTKQNEAPSRPVPSQPSVVESVVKDPSVPREVVHRLTVDNDRIKQEIQRQAPHRLITDEHVARVIADVLGRCQPRSNPTGLVLTSIRNDPARYLPAAQPPNVRDVLRVLNGGAA